MVQASSLLFTLGRLEARTTKSQMRLPCESTDAKRFYSVAMTFPVYFHIFGLQLHPHPTMEVIAYAAGFQLFRLTRAYWTRATVSVDENIWLIVAAAAGALVGSKLLAWIEAGPDFWHHVRDPRVWAGGKTIVGGLLGGWVGVEIAKRALHIRHSTGDALVFPLILGMAIGRIGCFLTGLSDNTCGLPTRLPWGVDFGDGLRHPAQLYDIVFLGLLAIVLLIYLRRTRFRPAPNGRLFRYFMFSYLTYRLTVEFIKPRFHPYLGLSAIQIVCLAGSGAIAFSLLHRLRGYRSESVLIR